MKVGPGKSLGPYEILSAIGAGGMGEVYKATDTRLNRTVAVKVLPEHVAANPELKQRFEREAQAIAALKHPNICVIYDVGEESGTQYLVMEYLEGETLAARLEKGAIPLDQALKCATEISDALDKAHQQGMIHRDVKPGNIMLTKSGAKLLDFGLAKRNPIRAIENKSELPTLNGESALTGRGTILGTLQYMSPEQIEGEEADARSDIFAFGAVLYEMVTGKKAFKGKSQASLMASILEHDPVPMSALHQMTPPGLDRVVRTCLAKEPGERWQNAHDLTLELKWIAEGGSQLAIPAMIARRKNRERIAWGLAALSMVGIIALAVAHFRTPPGGTTAVEFSIDPPENAVFGPAGLLAAPLPVVSPDGRHVAFLASSPGTLSRIWVRSLNSAGARVLAGTDGAFAPFWSADGREIGFFADGKLKRVEYLGGPVLIVCDASLGSGGTWNRDGVIVFAPQPLGGLHRVSAAGGESTPITAPDASQNETAHRYPSFLPDGRHFLYFSPQPNAVYVGSLDSKEASKLLNADSGAIYAPPGYLLFVRQGTLMGQGFDADRRALSGEPFRVAENVRLVAVPGSTFTGAAAFSVSDSGVLVYRTGAGISAQRSVWYDRAGRQLEPINQSGDSRYPVLSRDESRIVVQRQDAAGSDIWVIDLTRGANSRLTFNPTNESFPIWSPDGTRIVYASNQSGKQALYQKASTGSGSEELLLKSDQDNYPLDWSPDGRFILFRSDGPKTGQDIWVLPMTGERKPIPFLQTPFLENGARFSPDGKRVAYFSNESGTVQVFVQPFPATGGKWQVSVNGGTSLAWGRDGKELFFVTTDNRLVSVDVESGAEFRAGVPKPLFQVPGLATTTTGLKLGVTRDGKRFLLVTTGGAMESPITVLLNWTAALQK